MLYEKKIKIRYPCTNNNLKTNISHSKAIFNKFFVINILPNMDSPCKSRNVDPCPVDSKCRESNVIYQATTDTKENKDNTYIYNGISREEWK